jgi:hypothetical protein
MLFEKLVMASFAVKYYLLKLEGGVTDVCFTAIYLSSEFEELDLLKTRTIDLSQGIDYPTTEATIASSSLLHAVTRNREVQTAHHDMILYSKEGPIPVQLKASFKTPTGKHIKNQLRAGRNSKNHVDVLIWISLIEAEPRIKQRFKSQVVFLNGSGVCNGDSFDKVCGALQVQATRKISL